MSRPWMPLYVADYLTDTRHLSTKQHGVYLLLLMVAWKRSDGTLPNDQNWLRSNLPAMHGRTYNALVPGVLAEFFTLGDDGLWRSKRLQKEIEIALKFSRKQSENASKRWAKTKENNGLDNAKAMPARALQSQSHNIITSNISSLKLAHEPEPLLPSGEDGFPRSDFRAFPPSGSISYTPFEVIVRKKAPGADPDKVASNFRQFCVKNGIDMSHPNIWGKWETFCGKHKVQGLHS